MGYSPWGHKESDMTENTAQHVYIYIYIFTYMHIALFKNIVETLKIFS